jgi:predicted transglutaminase-like cysteine proteinase
MNLSKKMIACIAVILALFAFPPATHAQQRGDTAAMRQRQEAMIQKLTTDLKLTPVQVDSLKTISSDMQGKRREIFMDQSMSREDKMAKMAPLNEAANKRIQAVLGADLYKKYQDWMEQNRPQRGGGGGRSN